MADLGSSVNSSPSGFSVKYSSNLKVTKLTLNHDVFRYGIIKSHNKLNTSTLEKMVTYCLKKSVRDSARSSPSSTRSADKARSDTMLSSMVGSESHPLYPTLCWPSWRYIACHKLQITETLAWAYFDTFLAVSVGHDQQNSHKNAKHSPQQRRNDAKRRHPFINVEDNQQGDGLGDSIASYDFDTPLSTNLPRGPSWDKYREALTIPSTLKFVIFLFIQQLAQDPKKSLRRSLSGENWPQSESAATTPRPGTSDSQRDAEVPSGRRSSLRRENSGRAPLDTEKTAIGFVKDNLQTLLNICGKVGGEVRVRSGQSVHGSQDLKNGDLGVRNRQVSREVIDAFNFLFLMFKHDLTTDTYEKVSLESFFNPSKAGISEKNFKAQIHGSLSESPLGISGTVTNGQDIPNWTVEPLEHEQQTNNTPVVVKTNASLTSTNKRLIVSRLKSQALVRRISCTDLDILVQRCDNSTIFLTGAFKSVSLVHCTDCTIVLGSVYSVTKMNHCRGCRISVATRLMTASNCNDNVTNVLTPSHPLLLAQCRKLVIGPYNTCYPLAGDDQLASGLEGSETGDMFSKALNLHDHAVSSVASGNDGHRLSQNSPTPGANVAGIQKTYAFSPIVVPIQGSVSETRVLCKFAPLEYRLAWQKKLQKSNAIKQRLRKQMLNKQKQLAKQSPGSDDKVSSEAQPNMLDLFQQHFHQWLEDEGHRDQMDRIMALSETVNTQAKEYARQQSTPSANVADANSTLTQESVTVQASESPCPSPKKHAPTM